MAIFLFFSMFFKFKTNNIEVNPNNNLTIIKKNLIFGVILNLDWKAIAPFFISFQKAHFNNCDCAMFVKNLSQETINKIESFNMTIIKMQRSIKVRLVNYRYKLYEDFLRNNSEKYNLILSIDVRDSFFQKDIFKYIENIKSFLSFAIEDDYLSEISNKDWIIDAFGYQVYNDIKHKRIICGGTILGSLDKIIELSSIVWKILDQSTYSRENQTDQAVINYIIYYKKIFANDTIIRNENKDSPILTLGVAKNDSFIIDSENNILNIKGEIPAIVHQYDRHKNSVEKIL